MTTTTTPKTDADETNAPPLPTIPSPFEGEEKIRAQAWFEDKVVRAVRKAGHCTEALRILDEVFGAPLDTVGIADPHEFYRALGRTPVPGPNGGRTRRYAAYLDSDGVDCWNNTWRDGKGFDRKGFNVEGYDRDGYNKDGRDKLGFDRDGKDKNGIHKDDPARFVYDILGYDKDGYDRQGYNRAGVNREGKDMRGRDVGAPEFLFDVDGYDKDGWNKEGYDRAGNYSETAYMKYRRARNAATSRDRY